MDYNITTEDTCPFYDRVIFLFKKQMSKKEYMQNFALNLGDHVTGHSFPISSQLFNSAIYTWYCILEIAKLIFLL